MCGDAFGGTSAVTSCVGPATSRTIAVTGWMVTTQRAAACLGRAEQGEQKDETVDQLQRTVATWLARPSDQPTHQVDPPRTGLYRCGVQRLELVRVHVCQRCGRGRAELASGDGVVLSVPLDAAHAREMSAGPTKADEVRWLSELILAHMAATGAEPKEVVFDLDAGRLRSLVSFLRAGEPDVVAASPQEGLGLAVRGSLALYATDEALVQATTRAAARGSDTVH